MNIPDDVDALTVAWKDRDGVEKIRELDKRVLSVGGGWATIAFRFAEVDADGQVAAEKVNLRRYRKRAGTWQVHSKFVLSQPEQFVGLASALQTWWPTKA